MCTCPLRKKNQNSTVQWDNYPGKSFFLGFFKNTIRAFFMTEIHIAETIQNTVLDANQILSFKKLFVT